MNMAPSRLHAAILWEPKDFASLVYGSQVLQAEFTKLVAEHLRRDRPRTMGSLFWDLNEITGTGAFVWES